MSAQVTAPTQASQATGEGLSVFQTTPEPLPKGTKLAEVYRTINRLVAFMTQRKRRIDADPDIPQDRPLVSVKDFLARWNRREFGLRSFFVEGFSLEETDALGTFMSYANRWVPLVQRQLVKGGIENLKGNAFRPEFKYRDPTQDFFNEDGSIDENVATAIVYGAYQWLTDALNGDKNKEPESILKMHGVEEGEGTIEPEGQKALQRMAAFKNTAASSMGRYILDALGLAPKDGVAPPDYVAKLQSALGERAMVLLTEAGLIEQVAIRGDVLNGYIQGFGSQPVMRPDPKTGEPVLQFDTQGQPIYPVFEYVRVRRDEAGELSEDGEQIKSSTLRSRGVLQRLFSTEAPGTIASFTPRRFTQERAKKTGQDITEAQRRIVDSAMQSEHRVIPAMWDALKVLGDGIVLMAAGVRDLALDPPHVDRLAAVTAKNEALTEQLASMKRLVESAIDSSPAGIAQPFFVTMEVLKNFRVQVATRDLNLQASKIHRNLFYRPDWESTIRLDDEQKLTQFKIAIAQAFGLKIDAQPNEQTLDLLRRFVADGETQANRLALRLNEALANPDQTILTDTERTDIGRFAAKNEGVQTLTALVMWGRYLAAQQAFEANPQSAPKTFTVQLLVGVDGKTHGPITSHVALGAAANVDGLYGKTNQGGFYRASDGTQNFNAWYAQDGNFDLYENLAKRVLEGIESSPELGAIYTFTGPLYNPEVGVTKDGRKLAKTPLTSFVFGSSIGKSLQNMQGWFVDQVLDRIERVANGHDTKTSPETLIRSLNLLMGSSLALDLPIESLRNYSFSERERDMLKQAFYDTLGIRVRDAMKSYFADFIERRNAVNTTIQGAFGIYDAIHRQLHDEEMARLMDAGEVPYRTTRGGVRIPIEGMTAAQEQAFNERIAPFMPTVHTPYSKPTGNRSAGLMLAKTRNGAGQDERHEFQLWLGRLIESRANEGRKTNQMLGRAVVRLESSPGVGGLPWMMHSLESWMMHDSIAQGGGLQTHNVHDEAGNGVDRVIDTAQNINHSAFKGLLAFSPIEEVYDLLGRMLVNVDVLIENGTLSNATLYAIETTLRQMLPENIRDVTPKTQLASQVLSSLHAQHLAAGTVRLEMLSQLAYVDLYTWEGGQYAVTDQDRAQARQQLDELRTRKEPDAALIETAARVGEALAATKPSPRASRTQADPIVNDDTDLVTDLFGPLGTPAITPERDLVAFFAANPNPTALEVIAYLRANNKLDGINAKILGLVERTLGKVDASIRFRLVTRNPDLGQILDRPTTPSRGWYVATEDGRTEIYVLHPDFVHSGLTTEVLLHEMVHAAIAQIIANPTPDAQPLVAELNDLLTKAKEIVAGLSNEQQVEFSWINDENVERAVQELVAWGMTHRAFQRDVLNAVRMESKTLKNRLVSGMQAFIANLSALLFKKPSQALNNGLSILIQNVSGLLYGVSEQTGESSSQTLDNDTVSERLDRLTPQERSTLEEHYGPEVRGVLFVEAVKTDIVRYATLGAEKISAAIRTIIGTLHASVLAVAMIFNPMNVGPLESVITIPAANQSIQYKAARAALPADVVGMSESGRHAYSVLIPALKGKNRDKLITIADKPSGRIFVFDSTGKLIVQKKALYGLAQGDAYIGNNDLPRNRITPAGLFGLKLIDAKTGPNQRRTAGEYDFGKVFALEDPDAVVTFMHSVWLHEKDAAKRKAALANDNAADSRYSFGCINVDRATYKFLLDNHQAQMDGSTLFVVPDNSQALSAYLYGGAPDDRLVRQTVKDVMVPVGSNNMGNSALQVNAGFDNVALSMTAGGLIKAVTFKDRGIVVFNEAANLNARQKHALSLHEIGVHYGLERMVGTERFNELLAQIESLKGKNAAVDRAYRSVPADTKPELVNEEALAYLVENRHLINPVKAILQAIKTWFKKLFKRDLSFEEDVYQLAQAALNRFKRQVRVTSVPSLSMSPQDGFVKLEFDAALQASPTMHEILDRVVDAMGDRVQLTGSLSLSPVRAVYRPEGEQIHDLDFHFDGNFEQLKAYLKVRLPEAVRFNLFETDSSLTYSAAVPASGIEIVSIQKLNKGFLAMGRSAGGEIRELRPGIDIASVDFFVTPADKQMGAPTVHRYTGKDGRARMVRLLDPTATFDAKFSMGPDKAGRTKDIQDAVLAGESNPAFSVRQDATPFDAYSTQEVFNALDNGSVNPSFQAHLSGLLNGIVDTLHGPFGAMAQAMRKTEAGNPMVVWLKAIETGQAPFIASRIHANLNGSPQEDFVTQQVGAVVAAALDRNEVTATAVYRALDKLYKEAYARLTPQDFDSQDEYEAFFSVGQNRQDGSQRSDHLARFAALALGNERINRLMKFETAIDRSPWLEGATVAARLTHFFEKLLAVFGDRMARIHAGQAADERLQALVGRLVDIEARKRHVLAQQHTPSTYQVSLDWGAKKLIDAARSAVVGVTSSRLVSRVPSQAAKALANVTRLVAQERTDEVMGVLRRLRDRQFDERDGFAASLLAEFKGHNVLFQALLRATKHLESLRKDVITQHAKLALKSFANGEEFTKEQKEAVMAVFVRTGMHHLLDDERYTLAQIQSMLGNPGEIDQAIQTWTARLPAAMRDRYIEQVNALGYFKASGRVRTPVLMLNAHLISKMAGTQYADQVSASMAQAAVPALTVLVTLYAMKYLPDPDTPRSLRLLDAAQDILRTENARTDGNGVTFMLKLHRELERDSLDRLFKGNPALMMHGYTPELYNPHTAVQVANNEDGRLLIEQGWVKDAPVTQDGADPNQDSMDLYVLKDGGLASYLSGAVSMTGMAAKGTTKHNGFVNPTYADGLTNASMQADISHDKLAQLTAMGNPGRDLRMDRNQNMAPVFNEDGRIVNWRYFMAERTKDRVLERDSRFDQVIGTLAGSIFDKVESRAQNKRVIEALLEQYRTDSSQNPQAYIEIGARAENADMREIWSMLPDATQDDIRQLWGEPSMMVPKEAVNILFGYRKHSMAEIFRKDPDARRWIEQRTVDVFEFVLYVAARTKMNMSHADAERYKKRAATLVARGERMWQELVRETKDIIVVRTGIVLLGNMTSNVSLLLAQGVSLKDIARHHQVAIRAATQYQIDSARLAELEIEASIGTLDAASQRERVLLKDSIARNPVKGLIDEGLMPTIVDDVAAEEDIYSFKSEFVRRTEKLAEKINPAIRAAGRNLFMTRNTAMYQTLWRTTQLSDFIARYTLYQHLTQRRDNPLSHKDAVQEASDAFVNYDIPMHKMLQYSDDMGITMFTKYFLRIQRVLFKTAKEHPARVLMLAALNNYLDLAPIVTDSSFVHKLGNNPLHWGALQFAWTWDDVMPISMAMKLVK